MNNIRTNEQAIAQRWTPGLVSEGWTPIANVFLWQYAKLDPSIGHPEALLLIHLISHKWNEEAPFPSVNLLAKRMGVTESAVRNSIRTLERKGYLRRERAGKKTYYQLESLFQALEKAAFGNAAPPDAFKCTSCGKPRPTGAKFCGQCGREFSVQKQASEKKDPIF